MTGYLERVIVIGAGGFGREALDVLGAINSTLPEDRYQVAGVIDDGPRARDVARLEQRRIPYLGGIDTWLAEGQPSRYVLAIGNPQVREKLVRKIRSAGRRALTIVHPTAVIGTKSEIGAGTIVCSGVQVSTNVTVGQFVHLNPNCTIGHDTTLEQYVSVNPGAVISGEVTCEKGSLFGAGSVVLQGLTIGSGSTIGAAACVTRTVEKRATVKGVPAS